MTIEMDSIRSLVIWVRGERVLLDFSLATLYGVETKELNQAVKRNPERFPPDFMFQLTDKEWEDLRSQNVTSSWGGRRYNPYVFTEQGIAMLSGVLKSSKAIEVNILIMRAFVAIRRVMDENQELRKRIDGMELKYDGNFAIIFEAIGSLLPSISQVRNPIGFKANRSNSDNNSITKADQILSTH
ncbi:MAG: DNA-binding protein [Bacteroidetes bacterium]|nr:MAG: DNA-binding protein [Bacteroidota bacterium]